MPGYEYLLEDIAELGFYSSGPLGSNQIQYSDIYYWSMLSCVGISYWEVLALRKMSAAYLDQAELSKEDSCMPPWQAAVEAATRDMIASLRDETPAGRLE